MPPGVYVVAPSVLVTASVTAAPRVSLSEPLALLPGPVATRSVAVAVFTNGSAVKPEAKATGTVNTSLSATPVGMLALVVPKLVCAAVPVTAPHAAAPLATHVASAVRETPAGNVSVTVTLLATDGPALVTVTV